MTVRKVPESFSRGNDRYNAQKAWLDGFDAAVREIASRSDADPVEFALKALKNAGLNTECGACMEVAFTGVTTNEHTCEPRPMPVVVVPSEIDEFLTWCKRKGWHFTYNWVKKRAAIFEKEKDQ